MLTADITAPKEHGEAKDEPNDHESQTTGPRDTPETEMPYQTNDLGAIPWYDKTYMILEKKTGKAMTLTQDGLRLQDSINGPTTSNSWLCVSNSNYTGFLNTHARFYLGHDGNDDDSNDEKNDPSEVHAVAANMKDWECFIARQHPDRGYQLLSLVGTNMLYIMVGAAEGKIVRARRGDTLWVFEEV